MTNIPILTAITLTTTMTLSLSFGSTSYAENTASSYYNISDIEMHSRISENNAKSLVKDFLKRDFKNFGYRARNIKKVDNQWIVTIKDRKDFVATAYVNDTTGNIHISYQRHNSQN